MAVWYEETYHPNWQQRIQIDRYLYQGRTDFQEGDSKVMYRSIHEQIFSLPDDCLLYPGHDYRGLTTTSVVEEKQYNPRLGGELNENDFAGYMDNLGLAHPRKLEIAVRPGGSCDGQCYDARRRSMGTSQLRSNARCHHL